MTGVGLPLYSAGFATPLAGLTEGPCGGTGRRARLKIEFRKECWFDSGQGHQSGIRPALRKIEKRGKHETATRLRGYRAVFRYAIATGRAERDPTGGLRGALITPTVTHQATIVLPELSNAQALPERRQFTVTVNVLEGYEPFTLPSDGRTSHAIRHARGRARIELVTNSVLSCVNEDVISEKRYIKLVVVS